MPQATEVAQLTFTSFDFALGEVNRACRIQDEAHSPANVCATESAQVGPAASSRVRANQVPFPTADILR